VETILHSAVFEVLRKHMVRWDDGDVHLPEHGVQDFAIELDRWQEHPTAFTVAVLRTREARRGAKGEELLTVYNR